MLILKRYFGIHDSEWRRFYALSLLHFLIAFGCEIGRVGRDTFFLSNVGAGSIPLMYIFIAILMFILAGAYGAVINRISAHRFLIYYQALGAILLFVLWIALSFTNSELKLFPYIVFCVAESYIAFILIHFWAIGNETFDAFEGKKLFPLIGAMGLLGTIIGGASTFYLAHSFGTDSLFFVWGFILIVTIPLTSWCRILCSDKSNDQSNQIESQSDVRIIGFSAIRSIWRERLMRTLTYMAFPMWVIVYIIEYYYYDSLNRVFIKEEDLAGFLGIVASLSSAAGLLLQCMVTPILLRKFGVGSTGVIYPLTLTTGSICLLVYSLFPESSASALDLTGIVLLVIFARFIDTAIFYSIYDSSLQLLYYALADKIRDQGRAFIAGMVFPSSIAVAGALLMWFNSLDEPIYNVTFVAVSLGFLLVVLSLNVAPDYLKALLSSTNKDQAERREQVFQEIAKLEPSDIRYVCLQSIAAKDLNEALFAVDKVFEDKDDELYNELVEIIPNAQPEALNAILNKITPDDKKTQSSLIAKIEKRLLEFS